MASEQGDVEPGDLAQEQSGSQNSIAGNTSQQAQQDREEMRLRMQEEREEKRWKLLLDREDERRKADIVHQERWIEAEEARRKHEDEERLRREGRIEGLKLNPLEDRDNVDDYLNQFERIAELQGWEKETWSSHLLPYLTGIARSLYFALRPEEQNNYDSLRAALMKRFNLTADGYRRKFREARKETGETFEQFIVRLDGYFQKWASLSNKDVNKVEDLKDLIIAEQFMETLSTDLAIRVRERQPANVQEAARAADVVVEAKKSTRKVQMSGTSSSSSKGQGNDKVKDSKSVGLESDSLRVAREKGLCFKCKKPGHMKKDCKMAATVLSSPRKRVQKVPALCKRCSAKVFHPRCMVRLNGREVEALRDTGADSLIVDSTLVSPTMFTGKKKCITLASTGHQELCDTAHVMLESPFFTGKALALVMENSLVPVIIGNQVELEPGRECRVPVYSVDPEVGAVETRAMAHKKRTPEKPLPASKPLIGQIGPEQVLQMQQDDDTLKRVRENAESGQQFKVRSCTVHFEKRKKLLYRVYSGPTGSYSQLVVPKSLRDEVMHLAHDSAMAGHMAAKKTRERVWQSFYWPGMCSDIRREVPQESTGFAPFELLYGRTVRGPMHVLRQLWTKEVEDEEVKTASQYVVDLRNKIEETCEIARQSLAEAAQVHKKAFDKKAVQRSLKIGDKVLLLLPEKKNKLQMSWKGPYLVIGKKGLNDYIVKVKEREKLYHINLLKKYTDRTEENRKAATVVVEEEPEEVGYTSSEIPLLPLQAEEGPEDVNLDPQNADMHQELREVCSEFSDVLTDVPLLTTLDECEVVMSTDKPIRTPQYPLPHATRDIIKEEVDNMLKLNVIERAASPYSSPIVLVKKKDKKIRFCVDFRKINKSVVFDAEPMPDVDFLFAMIGKAKYLSKLDLSKGYWQTKALEQFFCRTRDKDSSLSPMPAGNSKELN
ncbi:uncharacterized protein LOC143281478 [Babylonia areolata]|uniref:uncharacterized protein LOC143281478 n=1 Tax=Babylonia areolata TaxID=304850 RepID=UPI003FD11ED8